MYTDNQKIQSETIDFLRFYLIVGVVFIHAQFEHINGVDVSSWSLFPVYNTVATLFSDILARVAVPFFFFISGFLFFYNTEFSFQSYLLKLKKRINSLLIPYLFWNALILFLFYIGQMYFNIFLYEDIPRVNDYSLIDIVRSFWGIFDDGENKYPICFQLWFVRDLMIVILFSPLVYNNTPLNN